LFAGTQASTPAASFWLYDHVWPQNGMCLDRHARSNGCIVDGCVEEGCPPWDNNEEFFGTGGKANFCADDYTWIVADAENFYFAWRDCSDYCYPPGGSRRDANIRFAKIRR
jgi:hypothetical protein